MLTDQLYEMFMMFKVDEIVIIFFLTLRWLVLVDI